MQLFDLLAYLPDEAVGKEELSDPEAEVYTVSFLTPEAAVLRDDVLYFGDTTLLASARLPETYNIVLYGSGTHEHSFARKGSNVVELAANANPFECYNALQELFMESQAQTDTVRRMLLAHFSNKGLQYLIEEAASALGNPIVVVDTTYRYIAYHLGNLEGSDEPLSQVIGDEIRNESLVEEAIAYIHNEGIDQQLAHASGPLVRHNSMLGAKTMTEAVMVNGVCVAHVMMVEHARPFSHIDRICFGRLAGFVGQEMQKNEIWNPTTGELGAFFLASLLNDHSPSEAVTLRRLKTLNFHPKKYLQMLCLHAPGEGFGQLQAEQVAHQLQPLLHHAIYTRFHQQLVILISRDEEEGVGPFGYNLLREVTSLNGITCGISNTFEQIIQARAAYDQARSAVRYGERASSAINDHRVFRFCDYSYVHALDLVDRKTNLLSLCHPSLNTLRHYDAKHGGELMDTLFCYLQVAGSTTRAAKLLTLHKNTLLYRLNRIKQILGTDLSSGEELFQLQMSFRILLYLGLFVPRMIVEREDLRG